MVEQYELCHQPLLEILKIMDKPKFQYDIDIGPQHHIYYYISATLYTLQGFNEVDFEKAIHYLFNVMLIVYKNLETMENLPFIFYDQILNLIKAIKINGKTTFFKQIQASKFTKNINIITDELLSDISNERVSLF